MKKTFLTLTIILISVVIIKAQQQYVFDNSKISFYSHTPVEDIKAVTKSSATNIDFQKQIFVFVIPINTFDFEKELMKKHFNENYLESEKYPNAYFKGNIIGNYDITKNGEYNVIAKGALTIHGVTKDIEIPSIIIVKDGKISIKSEFTVLLKDYNIKIPEIVFMNIAEKILVNVEGTLKLKPVEKKKVNK